MFFTSHPEVRQGIGVIDMMSIKEAAEKAGVAPTTIHHWIKTGRLKARNLGKQYVIEEEDLDGAIRARPQIGRPQGAKDKAPRRRTAKPRDEEGTQPG